MTMVKETLSRAHSVKDDTIAAKQEELRRSLALQGKLQDLCRELQKQNKQISKSSEELQLAEAKKREEALERVNATVSGISDRLTEQQAVISKQGSENEALRAKTIGLCEMLELMEKQAKQYEQERVILQTELQKQGELASLAMERYREGESKNAELLAQLQEYRDSTKDVTDAITKCHTQSTQLGTQNKQLLDHNKILKEQYDKGARMLLDALRESKAKDERITKLQLANSRLQSLCRSLRSEAGPPEGLVEPHIPVAAAAQTAEA